MWKKAGVKVRYGAAVTGLVGGRRDGFRRFRLAAETLPKSTRVIVSTGGSSYPATGTTGDGWKWLASLGHTARAPAGGACAAVSHRGRAGMVRASPCGTASSAPAPGEGGKEFMRWPGDLLFTHKGLSGPTALGVSREVAEREAVSAVEADLAPETEPGKNCRPTLKRQTRDNPRKSVGATGRAVRAVRACWTRCWQSAGVPGETRGAYLTAKALNKLVSILKGWPLGTVRHVPLERGEVVAGGIALDEVDPQTMRSRLIAGLLFVRRGAGHRRAGRRLQFAGGVEYGVRGGGGGGNGPGTGSAGLGKAQSRFATQEQHP